MKTIEIVNCNAPIEKVFEYISTPDKQKLWMDGLVKTEYINPWYENQPVGIRFKQHLIKGPHKTSYEFLGEILEYKRPTIYSIKISNHSFDALIHYNFTINNGQTQLITETTMKFHGNIFARFIGRMAAHHNKQDMKKLIAMLEKI